MVKEKIAIAIDPGLLALIDSKIGNKFMSRSQAIESLLRKGLQEELIRKAVLLLKGEHQKYSLKILDKTSLISNQASFLKSYGINELYIITQKSKYFEEFLKQIEITRKKLKIKIEIYEKKVRGNAEALATLKNNIKENFLAMSGDVHFKFNLFGMFKKHLSYSKIATMGLMTRNKPIKFGNAVLDGDLIIDFIEKPRKAISYVVNAGIYLFSPKIFTYLKNAVSLERHVFPKLSISKQLVGHFISGEYRHMED